MHFYIIVIVTLFSGGILNHGRDRFISSKNARAHNIVVAALRLCPATPLCPKRKIPPFVRSAVDELLGNSICTLKRLLRSFIGADFSRIFLRLRTIVGRISFFFVVARGFFSQLSVRGFLRVRNCARFFFSDNFRLCYRIALTFSVFHFFGPQVTIFEVVGRSIM